MNTTLSTNWVNENESWSSWPIESSSLQPQQYSGKVVGQLSMEQMSTAQKRYWEYATVDFDTLNTQSNPHPHAHKLTELQAGWLQSDPCMHEHKLSSPLKLQHEHQNLYVTWTSHGIQVFWFSWSMLAYVMCGAFQFIVECVVLFNTGI